jgi:hypothetical protein
MQNLILTLKFTAEKNYLLIATMINVIPGNKLSMSERLSLNQELKLYYLT